MKSTVALKALPAAADAIDVTCSGGAAWSNGNWAQISASAPANSVLAGILVFNGTFSNNEREVDVGIGAAASEAAIATFRIGCPTSGGEQVQSFLAPVPIRGIAGQRVSARIRTNDAGGDVLKVAVLYLDNPSTQITTDKILTCVPSAADGVTITPNGTAWTYSSWVQLTSGLSNPVAIAGIAWTSADAPNSFEFELGTGAGGAEVGITKLRGGFGNGINVQETWMLLNGIYTLAASTRIAIRFRKSGTTTTVYKAALLYYDNLRIQGGGGAGAGKGSKGNKGGGGVNILTPGSPVQINFNPAVDVSSP